VSVESSNFRELKNLVDSLYDQFKEATGSLLGREVFIFANNAVAEGAFYRGMSSTSPKLFELVFKLRRLELRLTRKL